MMNLYDDRNGAVFT